MKPKYFIRQEGGADSDIWHGPYEVMPKKKLRSLMQNDPNEINDYTVYRCQVVPVEWDKL